MPLLKVTITLGQVGWLEKLSGKIYHYFLIQILIEDKKIIQILGITSIVEVKKLSVLTMKLSIVS